MPTTCLMKHRSPIGATPHRKHCFQDREDIQDRQSIQDRKVIWDRKDIQDLQSPTVHVQLLLTGGVSIPDHNGSAQVGYPQHDPTPGAPYGLHTWPSEPSGPSCTAGHASPPALSCCQHAVTHPLHNQSARHLLVTCAITVVEAGLHGSVSDTSHSDACFLSRSLC